LWTLLFHPFNSGLCDNKYPRHKPYSNSFRGYWFWNREKRNVDLGVYWYTIDCWAACVCVCWGMSWWKVWFGCGRWWQYKTMR
jgi:hypothetical protein